MSPTKRPFDRPADMAWLSARYSWSGSNGPDFHNASPTGRVELITWLEARCRSMRAAGMNDLPTHTELKRILDAERVALAVAATESLPVPPIRRRLRAA